MAFKIFTSNGTRKLNELNVGDLILCENSTYNPIRSISVTTGPVRRIYFSNGISMPSYGRMRVLTTTGFKVLEIEDIVFIAKNNVPFVTKADLDFSVHFLYDILIDGNMITTDGIIFRFGD
jgi:hypothetical protein